MSHLSRRRHAAAIVVVGLIASIVLGCAPGATSSTLSPAPAPPSAAASADADAGVAVDVETLLRDTASKDWQTVRVTGNFLADAGSAQLCQVLMESYPPQCGGGVRVTGTVPADTLARLTTTTEPGLKKMWWGFATITGTFHATGADGLPSIEISEIVLADT